MARFLLFQPQNGLNPGYYAPNQRSNSADYKPRLTVIGAISQQILSYEAATIWLAVQHTRKEVQCPLLKDRPLSQRWP